MRFYTYIYYDLDNTPIYVGKGEKDRWYSHYKNRGKNHLGNKIAKYLRNGICLVPQITYHANETDAFTEEMRLIDFFGRIDKKTGTLYNLTSGGQGGTGVIRTEEQREHLRLLAKLKREGRHEERELLMVKNKPKLGRWPSKKVTHKVCREKKYEYTRKYNIINRFPIYKGMPLNELKLQAIWFINFSRRLKGIPFSESHKASISAANKGKKKSEVHKANMSKAQRDLHKKKCESKLISVSVLESVV